MFGNFFKQVFGHATSPENLPAIEWKREPTSGWDLDTTYHFYGQLEYYFNEGSNFKMIIIGTNEQDGKFNINFQKQKNPLQFVGCLGIFNFEYDSLQKEIQNYEIKAIDFNRLVEVLDLLHRKKYISQSLLQNIQSAISPENPDLIKLKQAKESDAKKPIFIYENSKAKQLSLDTNLHVYILNEDKKLYRPSVDDFTSYVIPTIESLLKSKANPNATYNYQTPLMNLITSQACSDQTKQIANLLLQYGAELHARNMDMRTVLHLAALNQNKLWIIFLLDKGADVTLTDEHGCTPKQTYLDTCKFNSLKVDPEIDAMLEKIQPVETQRLSN